MRSLTESERTLARSVFESALDLEPIRVARGPARFAVTLGPVIIFPADSPADFATASRGEQAWFIHELVHVWQFQTRPSWTLISWAKVLATGGYGPGQPGYAYAHPFGWARLNLEQQARVVEHAWLLREGEGVASATLAHYAGRTPFEALTRRA